VGTDSSESTRGLTRGFCEDPEGNVVEVWDFFERSPGARDGVDALK